MQCLDFWDEVSLDEVLPPSGHWGPCQPFPTFHFPICLWKDAPISCHHLSQFTGRFPDGWLVWVLTTTLTPMSIPIWPVRTVKTRGVIYQNSVSLISTCSPRAPLNPLQPGVASSTALWLLWPKSSRAPSWSPATPSPPYLTLYSTVHCQSLPSSKYVLPSASSIN